MILTEYNFETGISEVITEKKVRSQKSLAFKEAIQSRMGLAVHGK